MQNSLLIIDDEEIILQTLQIIFRKNGIAAEIESNPLTAIERYEQKNFNVVLVDVLMPQMLGSEVIQKIKSINPLCNIIMMTAFSSMAKVIECIENGAVDYVTKPFTDIPLLLEITQQTIQRVNRWEHSFGITSSSDRMGL